MKATKIAEREVSAPAKEEPVALGCRKADEGRKTKTGMEEEEMKEEESIEKRIGQLDYVIDVHKRYLLSPSCADVEREAIQEIIGEAEAAKKRLAESLANATPEEQR